ncbi:hypothetical protein SME10J_09280 [Serratia marcescens]|nr:hypothetical protein SME10J_09280 [Serratia marcescens]
MASLANQQTAAAIFYAVLGRNPSEYSFKNFGESLETGQYTTSSFVNLLLTSVEGTALYQGKSSTDIVTKVYTLVYGSTPNSTTVTDLLAIGSLPVVLASIVDTVLHYQGYDASLLSSQLAFTNKVNSILYSSTASLPPLNLQEQIAALYLGIPGREVDSSGLKYWSTEFVARD